MIKREIMSALQEWRLKKDRRPLILRGARQVGKTTIIKEFGSYFNTFLHLNLEKRSDAMLFEKFENPQELLAEIHLHLKKNIQKGDTLLFIDEIQNSPAAISILRYFYEEVPELYVIAAGSLLENLVDVHQSFPVGRVEFMAMRPCSFLEFLNGTGCEFDAEAIRSRKIKSIHNRLMSEFRQYMIVGGMPAVINSYAESGDILGTEPIYELLITSYREDAEKYGLNETQRRALSQILTSGWAEAAETISFNNFGGSNFGSREIADALRTLERAMLLELVYPVVTPVLPLVPNMRRRPKLIWFDTGLTNYQSGIRDELFSTTDVMDMWRGRLGEQIVAQELIAYNHSVLSRRFFWSRDKKESSAEVDFVIRHRNMVVPIEVKTGHNSKLRSLHSYMETAPHDIAVRIWNGEFSTDDLETPKGKRFTLINLPFYYISQLSKIIDSVSERNN